MMNTSWVQRVERDMKEAVENPIPGVYFARDEERPYEAKIRLTALSGPMKGTVVDLDLKLPMNYPLSPPRVTVRSDFRHPNVYGDWLCLDMLRTGRAPYSGWTPAYTLHALLFQLSTFLLYDTKIDQDYGGSIDREQYLKSSPPSSSNDDQQTKVPITDGGGSRATSFRKDDDEVVELLRLMEDTLDLGSVEGVMTAMTPDTLQKALRLHPSGNVGNVAYRMLCASNGKQCFCTKKSLEDPDTVMGIGLHVQNYKDGNLKSISPSTTFVSKEAMDKGVRRDVWNQNHITHFLPLVFNRNHAPKALVLIPDIVTDIVGCARKDAPLAVLHVVALAMTTLAAEMMMSSDDVKRRYVSDAAMEVFLHLHHLLVTYAEAHEEVAIHARRVLHEFVWCPGKRRKAACPNLGLLFVYMLLVPEDVVSWRDLAPPLLREMLARTVYHATKSADGLELVSRFNEPAIERCARHFRCAHVGLKIMALQAWFGNALARPSSSERAAAAQSFESIKRDYDTFSGQPSKEVLDGFYRRFREISAIANWRQFLTAVHVSVGVVPGETPLDRFARVLKQAVRDSQDAGYHQQPIVAPRPLPVFENWNPDRLPLIVHGQNDKRAWW